MCQGANVRSKKTVKYTRDQLNCIDSHVSRHFGQVTQVLKDHIFSKSKFDLLIVEPTPSRNFFTVVTRGLGAYVVDRNYENNISRPRNARDRFELIICLDSSWHISDACNEDELWPLKLLLSLCHYHNGQDQVIQSGLSFDNEQPYANNTDLCAVVVDELSDNFSSSARDCLMPNHELVHFLQLLPIYKYEFEFLEHFGFENFKRHMLNESFIVHNNRTSSIDPKHEYFNNIACDYRWQDRVAILKNNKLATGLELSHLAWLMRFCYDSDLLATSFYTTFEEFQKEPDPSALGDLFLELVSNQLGGVLDLRYFNDIGEFFVSLYLNSDNFPSYISDLEDIAINRVGVNSYYTNRSTVLDDITLPYTERTYDVIRSVLRQRLRNIKNQVFYEGGAGFDIVALLTKHLDCSVNYYPSLQDPDPIYSEIRNAFRLGYYQKGYPVLIEVTEQGLRNMLKYGHYLIKKLKHPYEAADSFFDDPTYEYELGPELNDSHLLTSTIYRNQEYKPLHYNYINHIFRLLKEAFAISQAAQEAFQELFIIYDRKQDDHTIPERKEYEYVYHAETNTHIDLGYEDKNNGYDPFELNATYDKKIYEVTAPAEGLTLQEELKERALLAITNNDKKLNIFALKSIYSDHTNATKPLMLAHIPVRVPYDTFGYLPYNIEIPGLTLNESMEIIATWYQEFGAMPFVFCNGMVEFITPKPIKGVLARRLAYEIIALCPKVRLLIDDGVLTVGKIICDIKDSHSFTLDFSPVMFSINRPYGY